MPQYKELFEVLDKLSIEYEKNAKTALLVSFRVGGLAEIVIYPKSICEFCIILEQISKKKYKYFILCKGTNTYFTDGLYNGIVISTKKLNKVEVNGKILIAECGASMIKCCEYARESSLTGLEFAYGIPGGIGGALYMNASAYEKSISQIVYKSIVYDMTNNEILGITASEHEFKEKSSVFNHSQLVLLKTFIILTVDEADKINTKMENYLRSRLIKQPCNLPSAGSVFKRPKNAYASKLIDETGLKGVSIGGASVSTLHAGFIVNSNGATSKDINSLVDYVYKQVKMKFNVELEREIIFVE